MVSLGESLSAALDAVPAVAIVRAQSAELLPAIVDVLAGAGVRAVELPLTTPGALEAINDSVELQRSSDALVGAGTVLDAADARAAIDAGAQFLVTPVVAPDAIAAAAERGVPVLCGAMTPTEILAAYRGGAWAVKVFPASLGGQSFVKAVREPLPQIPLVPTGGVSIDAAAEWMALGVRAVALGSPLVGDAIRGGSLDELAERARQLVANLSAAG
ncbi:MAG TPA: bifunctional 4-hydroxy-2-oxoglutarate aldolase/2-dehydro-3-deoxy-phosphogluconate aldolase [Conexibacter sp.]|jgi:2-dehydro-3-deoxyphosphogluconate aldolase/(4S)-4-hydroxy-2-oxoglutarate aldolase